MPPRRDSDAGDLLWSCSLVEMTPTVRSENDVQLYRQPSTSSCFLARNQWRANMRDNVLEVESETKARDANDYVLYFKEQCVHIYRESPCERLQV